MDTSTKTAALQHRGTPSMDEMAAANPHVDRSVLSYYDRLNTGFHQKQLTRPVMPVSLVSRAHEHIVRARWPQARYLCGADALAAVNLLTRVPELVKDYVMLLSAVGWNSWKK